MEEDEHPLEGNRIFTINIDTEYPDPKIHIIQCGIGLIEELDKAMKNILDKETLDKLND